MQLTIQYNIDGEKTFEEETIEIPQNVFDHFSKIAKEQNITFDECFQKCLINFCEKIKENPELLNKLK